MPLSEHPGAREGPEDPSAADRNTLHDSGGDAEDLVQPEVNESWDPVDDEVGHVVRHRSQWSWHGRPSWGRRVVASFPVVAVALAVVLMVSATVSAQGAIERVQSVVGTGGAALLSSAPAQTTSAGPVIGQPADYRDVTFNRPSGTDRRIQGSTSLAVPPYAGWEANGSARAGNAFATVSHGLLHVGVRHPTPVFRGWFLTANSATPDSCVFQFAAASPPPVTVSNPRAIGELVMAVQTSNTITTGDINYVLVAENVLHSGQRTLVAGYARGHLAHATEHILKEVPWVPGPLRVAIQTNGNNRLKVWVNGALFLDAVDLHMGIVPPFEPYLEVQARSTAYTVAFRSYSSVCHENIVISNLPDGSVVRLGHRRTVAHSGTAVFPAGLSSAPVTGSLTVALPDNTQRVQFPQHTYWPGDRYSFEAGT